MILILAAATCAHIRNDSLRLESRRHILLQIGWRRRDYLCVRALPSRHQTTFRRVRWVRSVQGRRVPGWKRQHLLQTVWSGQIPRSDRCLVLEFYCRPLPYSEIRFWGSFDLVCESKQESQVWREGTGSKSLPWGSLLLDLGNIALLRGSFEIAAEH